MALYSVPAHRDLGPIFVKQRREQYPPELGETCSRTDSVFQDTTSGQKLNFQPNPNAGSADYVFPKLLPAAALPDPKDVIFEYRKMIREQVERRILFFFQQAIVCHQTKLHFESVGAQDQGQSADAIFVKIKNSTTKFAVRQAAHSAGNPCIVAYDKRQWDLYKAGAIAKPQGFVFLKGTDYYRTMNATMNMPRWMNDADREIDEKTSNSLLREKGEGIINRDAQGLLTPDQAVLEYIQEALNEVRSAKQRLFNRNKDPEVQEVLAYYEKYFAKFQTIVQNNPAFLENFLNIKLGQNENFKKILLQMRYAAIRNCQLNQSKLIQKIENLKKTILTGLKAGNANRKPDNFDAAFRAIFIGCARSVENRQRLEKLLNFSAFNFEAQTQGAVQSKYSQTKTAVMAYQKQIDFVVRDVLEDMRKLRTLEQEERSLTTKRLRHMKGWTQVKFGQEVKKLFPAAAASQTTISNIERKKKLVTEPIATEFSQVFGVDAGLFMPHFYYD